jgi:hypothetical protein
VLHDQSCLVSFAPTVGDHRSGGVVPLARIMRSSTEVLQEIKAGAPVGGRVRAVPISWLT